MTANDLTREGSPGDLVAEWYEKEYKDKSYSRFETFSISLKTIYNNNEFPVIVETGCIRALDDYGAGYSTKIFAECIKEFGGELYSIDTNNEFVDFAKSITDPILPEVNYILGNSIEVLKTFNKKIDLLYLDSMDCPPEGDASKSQIHNLNEYYSAKDKLTDNCVILIDDVGFDNGGKALITNEILKNENYNCLLKHQQVVWVR
tara:strand:- start:4017 stop:4628 length:612 start_codon:yes stop_codon:yes gene_type:complete